MKSVLTFVIALAPFLISAQQVPRSLVAQNGTFIGFYEYKPVDYDANPNIKYPVIIFLHGVGERGNGTTDLPRVLVNAIPKYINNGHPMRFFWNGKWETFLVLSPQLSTAYGSWQNFYVDEMLNYARSNMRIDTNRIILTGLSLGGGGVWQYASSSPENARKFAAIAPVCGTCAIQNACNIANNNLPTWAFHAQNDGTVGVGCTTGAIASINNCSPATKPLMTIYPDGNHFIWDKAYDTVYQWQNPNIYEWFLGQNKSLATNQLPTARAGADLTISSNTGMVNLSGIASTDSDGKIVKYIWKNLSGFGNILTPTSTNGLTEITQLNVPGTYSYELTVIDDRTGISKDVVNVTVTNNSISNIPPVAVAGNDLSTPLSAVTLDAENSYDPDGVIIAYNWNKLSGPGSSIISNPTSPTPVVSNLTNGIYQFVLTAQDNLGATSTDTITIVSSSAILPLRFVSFTVQKSTEGNQLLWQTQSEFNNDHFNIEYSGNGQQFQSVGQLQSLGDAINGHTYSFIHKNLSGSDLAYYRIRQIDKDGHTTYSPIIVVSKTSDGRKISLSPNPASHSITIATVFKENGQLLFRIFSANGKLVQEKTIVKSQQAVVVTLPVSHLLSGAYYLQVSVNGKGMETRYFFKN